MSSMIPEKFTQKRRMLVSFLKEGSSLIRHSMKIILRGESGSKKAGDAYKGRLREIKKHSKPDYESLTRRLARIIRSVSLIPTDLSRRLIFLPL